SFAPAPTRDHDFSATRHQAHVGIHAQEGVAPDLLSALHGLQQECVRVPGGDAQEGRNRRQQVGAHRLGHGHQGRSAAEPQKFVPLRINHVVSGNYTGSETAVRRGASLRRVHPDLARSKCTMRRPCLPPRATLKALTLPAIDPSLARWSDMSRLSAIAGLRGSPKTHRVCACRGKETAMHIKFWGVRGSTPTPQPENMRYGGNTSCVEVRVGDGLYIFDCGTGLRNLGKALGNHAGGISAHIFISHFHWDHIQGIPFFTPLYDSGENRFFFHSSSRTRSLQRVLEEQMNEPYFPVDMGQMAAHRHFHDIGEGQVNMENCVLRTMALNHPQGCLGFRMETRDGVLVYATDNEPGQPLFDKQVRKLAEGAD